uniref:Uncharacterized protein n=1 Tax=Arundo donax TaxID=35708 RepID=A0A0A9ASA1_ARUDO
MYRTDMYFHFFLSQSFSSFCIGQVHPVHSDKQWDQYLSCLQTYCTRS